FRAGQFPMLGGFMYFDALGAFTNCPYVPANAWTFDAYGGKAGFITMGQSTLFAVLTRPTPAAKP
ncbi:MAG: hypothetical protein ACRELE_02430, partial [Gemmatimonadales bacterium]